MADKYPEIFVLRHGQTEWNLAGRFQGRLDSPLTETGRGQALTQAEILAARAGGHADLSAYCSPQPRALRTAEIALAPLGLMPAQDPRLCEISFGVWEGLTFDQIAMDWPDHVSHADFDGFEWQFQSPGGEDFDQMRQRVTEFLDHLSGPSIIVTHGITSRILRGVWLGHQGNEIAGMPGGQGCVYHLRDGRQMKLEGGEQA